MQAVLGNVLRALLAAACGIAAPALHGAAEIPLRLAQVPGYDSATQPGRETVRSTRRPVEVEFGATHENLTHGLSDWDSVYVEGAVTFKERHKLYGGLRETRRFGQDDTEAYGGLYYPLDATWTGVIEGSASPSYNVLAKYSIGGQLLKSLPAGWSLGISLRHNEYSLSAANVVSLTGERYWGNFRAAYTLYSGRPEGESSAAAHRFQLAYFYGDRDWISISYTTGREVEYVGPPLGTITSDVRDWTLSGRHWFAPRWALSYDLLTHEQGSLYRRQGGRLGIRHLF
jgi:YaiO family outer membrane protein